MTLQYRIRSKYEDERWRHRVILCEALAADAIDQWCRTDDEFPVPAVVAGTLYLFAPRCDPYDLSPHRLVRQLAAVADDPAAEYARAWPRRNPASGVALVAALTAAATATVAGWAAGRESSAAELAGRLVDEIVARQYVVFHHRETTRRDINPFGI